MRLIECNSEFSIIRCFLDLDSKAIECKQVTLIELQYYSLFSAPTLYLHWLVNLCVVLQFISLFYTPFISGNRLPTDWIMDHSKNRMIVCVCVFV